MAFYYNFIPSKEEEEACKQLGIPFPVTRVRLHVEDTDTDTTPPPPPAAADAVCDFRDKNPWKIKKTLVPYEVATGKILLSSVKTYDHILRHWRMEMVNYLARGYKVSVVLWDVTDDEDIPKVYRSNNIFLEMLPNDDYSLACMDLFQNRRLNIGDEIGLLWDPSHDMFKFKIFRKPIRN